MANKEKIPPESRALVPAPLPSLSVTESLRGQTQALTIKELQESLSDVFTAGNFVLFSSYTTIINPNYVEGDDTRTEYIDFTSGLEDKVKAEMIPGFRYRAIIFTKPLEEEDSVTFLINVALPDPLKVRGGGSYNAGEIGIQGFFLLGFPRTAAIELREFKEFLNAWAGRLSSQGLDQLFPPYLDYSLEALEAGRKKENLFFKLNSIYPPGITKRPTYEWKFVDIEAGGDRVIKIIPVNTEATQKIVSKIVALNRGEIAAAEPTVEQLTPEEVKDRVISLIELYIERPSIVPEELSLLKRTLDEVLKQARGDSEMFDNLREAMGDIVHAIHPDTAGKKEYNPEVVSVVLEFFHSVRTPQK